jgi:hypothetical protein
MIDRGFDTLVLTPRNSGGSSTGFNSVKDLERVFPHAKVVFHEIYLLSDIMENRVSPDWSRRNLIINNTSGNMLTIHGASDLSVVFGPINFFEPLSVGTPTVVVSIRN